LKHLILSVALLVASGVWAASGNSSSVSSAAVLLATTYFIYATLVHPFLWLRKRMKQKRIENKKMPNSSVKSSAILIVDNDNQLSDSEKIEIASAAVTSKLSISEFAHLKGLSEETLREWIDTYLGGGRGKVATTVSNDVYKTNEDEFTMESETETQPAAFEMSLSATLSCVFDGVADVSDGSLYLAAIDLGSVVLIENSIGNIEEFSGRNIIQCTFWESEINYDYNLDEDDENNWVISVQGSLAAEAGSDLLGGIDIIDLELRSIVLAWAEDGDSPKVIASDADLEESEPIEVNFIEDFVEYP
jgi:transposase-like protein